MNRLYLLLAVCLLINGCQKPTKIKPDESFKHFEDVFLDAYWKQYPTNSIFIGYGKYYDNLVIPDSSSIAADITFSKHWIDSLSSLDYNSLSDNNKVSFAIIKNQLEADIWYSSVFRQEEWDPSVYNLSGECYYLITQPYAPLDKRLRDLSDHIQNADKYYEAGFRMLKEPTKEHLDLAIAQNTGGLSVFGEDLMDSIRVSGLSEDEKQLLKERVDKTKAAINNYIASLKTITNFRSFRIGKEMFSQKFKYDLAISQGPEELYDSAVTEKRKLYKEMYTTAEGLWTKYCKGQKVPTDTLKMIQTVIDKISLQHATPEGFFDSLKLQVDRATRFIVEKDLFNYDTTNAVTVRYMPDYASGVTVASAEFTPPYQKKGDTYYNIDDLTKYTKERAESTLREYNNYTSELLSIHEAMPGHCLQGIYNNKNSPDVLRAVFQNGPMVEGWAVYAEEVMLEHGWDSSPEMRLMNAKKKLRVLGNVIIDYDIQCLDKSEKEIMDFLVRECFQTQAQADEKYHRATLSQVQLCSYYAGYIAIRSLREEYKQKMGEVYSVKDFHETFLSFGSSPVNYIRERMISNVK